MSKKKTIKVAALTMREEIEKMTREMGEERDIREKGKESAADKAKAVAKLVKARKAEAEKNAGEPI